MDFSIGLEMSTNFIRAIKGGIVEDDSWALFQSFREAVAGILDDRAVEQSDLITVSLGSPNQ